MNIRNISVIALVSATGLVSGCGKKKSEPADSNSTNSNSQSSPGEEQKKFAVAGTIQLETLPLLATKVTHAVALNVETGKSTFSEVKSDGTFTLELEKAKPWIVSYIDSNKQGHDMIVSSFASGTLDTINAGDAADKLDMGSIGVSGSKATMTAGSDAVLAAIKMSSAAAETVGALDDVSLRYSNPDIDNNGKVDAVEGKSYMVDFHNRFEAKTPSNAALSIQDMKNKFYPDDTLFSYTGTGIMPQIPKADLGGVAPTSYGWKFSDALDTATNGGATCLGLGAGVVLPANTECVLTHTNDIGANGDQYFVFNFETKLLKAGDYTLLVGGKTYQWTNVAVSDFSAGRGFLALFIKIDVDGSDKVTGLSYKWQKRRDDGTYTLASAEEVALIVKRINGSKYGGNVSLKYQGNEQRGSLGVLIPIDSAEGQLVFRDLLADTSGTEQPVNVSGTDLTKDMVKSGISFSDLTTNPGISYDDKLGMRFFF